VTANDFDVRELRTPEEFAACVALQREIWGHEFNERVPATLLRLTQRLGGIAGGAFERVGTLLGFVFGMPGVEAGKLIHWSDMLGVRQGHRDRGIGEALKRYQRDTLLPFGVERVYWTFDPLESRNAYFNFERLGAISNEYRTDYYGESTSPLHAGIGTDRLIVTWLIKSARVRDALDGKRAPSAPDALRIEIPADIQTLKKTAPNEALQWREQSRTRFIRAFSEGYVVAGFTRSGETGFYRLERAAFDS
jgi:predicted GNAT superfamily acetyltransferase